MIPASEAKKDQVSHVVASKWLLRGPCCSHQGEIFLSDSAEGAKFARICTCPWKTGKGTRPLVACGPPDGD